MNVVSGFKGIFDPTTSRSTPRGKTDESPSLSRGARGHHSPPRCPDG
jgi:hypothetical protein